MQKIQTTCSLKLQDTIKYIYSMWTVNQSRLHKKVTVKCSRFCCVIASVLQLVRTFLALPHRLLPAFAACVAVDAAHRGVIAPASAVHLTVRTFPLDGCERLLPKKQLLIYLLGFHVRPRKLARKLHQEVHPSLLLSRCTPDKEHVPSVPPCQSCGKTRVSPVSTMLCTLLRMQTVFLHLAA